MYNLIEYSLNYSEATRSLWFYCKDDATNFNAYIANDNDFKYFMYKAELLGNTEADGVNRILKNAAIVVPSKYSNNPWRSLEIPLINCKVELKLKWAKHYVLSVASNDCYHFNVNIKNSNNRVKYQRHKIIRSCCNFISKRQPKTI